MNYSDPQLIDALARQYVLGTLGYLARRRFARILEQNPLADERVMHWEERLSPLALSLDPLQPSVLVWQRIARAIGEDGRARPGAARGQGVMQAAVIALLAIAVAFTSLGWWQASRQLSDTLVETRPEAAAVSILADADGSYWIARIYRQSARLEVEVLSAVDAQADRDYELWTLQDDGIPVSLGLLPAIGSKTLVLEAQSLAAIARSQMLAVSLEPRGGSPQPVPTGPVLYSGPLYQPRS